MKPPARRALAALMLGASLLTATHACAQGRRGPDYFPNVPVVTQEGKTVSFYDDIIRDRVVVVSFIFTRCRDICPLTTARLAQIADDLGDAFGRDVFFVSISVDPENDTAENLKDFADAFYTRPGWFFLTGTPENIRAINRRFGEHMRALTDHRNEILLGNDATGEWARNSVFGDMARLVHDIRSMDPKHRARATELTAAQSMPHMQSIGGQGQMLYSKLCAGCHSFDAARRVGPDLSTVMERRPRDWLARFILDPRKLHAEKDPTALELAARFPGVRMPSLGLTDNDVTDLIAYLDWQGKRPRKTDGTSAAASTRR